MPFSVLFLFSAFCIASTIFAFTLFWYSKFLFLKTIKNLYSKINTKHALIIEFSSSLLLSLAVMVVFVGFNVNALFGFINGIFVSIAIILPIAISIAVWSSIDLKEFFIFTMHRIIQIVIAFSLSGFVNNLIVF